MTALIYGKWSLDGIIPEGKMAIFSVREMEVLNLMCQGLTNRKIADKLGINEHTIKHYVGRLMDDLDCNNRTEVALKVTHGLVKIAKSPFVKLMP